MCITYENTHRSHTGPSQKPGKRPTKCPEELSLGQPLHDYRYRSPHINIPNRLLWPPGTLRSVISFQINAISDGAGGREPCIGFFAGLVQAPSTRMSQP